ncbi:hypothetical protein CRG98_025269 [Punica granatum]|uniref:Uncharacterized protein n=1 Tax=Punica granatum TaxID=22663 RepID=A0A2I0JE97_PUNGR|nr:hypothetical protein CRG98_025269 [Punica granatum]
MLSKTAWILTSNTNSFASRVMKAKYGNFIAPLQSSTMSTSSIWKGLLSCKNTLQSGTCLSIGDDVSTSVWHSPWIPGNTTNLSDCLRRIKHAIKEHSDYKAPLPHFELKAGQSLHTPETSDLSDDWTLIHTDAAWTTESFQPCRNPKTPQLTDHTFMDFQG